MMKKFISQIIYISLPLLIAAIGMEVLLRNIPNDYLAKKEYLDQYAAEVEILILGSSHSFYGFNPAFFTPKTFNASHISQSLNYDLEIVKKYETQFKNLKNIILPISYFTLFEKLDTEPDAWRLKNYHIYYGINTSKSFIYYSEILSIQFNLNLTRLVSYYLFKQPTITCTQLGWGTNFQSKNAQNLLETGKTTSQRHTKNDVYLLKSQAVFLDNQSALNTLIEWSKKRNIKVLLLTPPAFESYRQNLHPVQLNFCIETANKIASKYTNCLYLNLLSDANFKAQDFYDADHLSEIGAAKLSTLINNKINEWE
jgi:hypothetical protein